MLEIFFKALVENWPTAAVAVFLARITWNLRGWKDVIERTSAQGDKNEHRLGVVEGDVNRIKGHLGVNGSK